MNVVKLVNKCKNFKGYSNLMGPFTNSTRNLAVNYVQINTNINKVVPIATVVHPFVQYRKYSSNISNELVDSVTYEKVCDETLDSLCEYIEELIEGTPHLKEADVTYSSGVLTINFGAHYGTYVINRQSPNRQIWLSSPTSGPKRYDFIVKRGTWIYNHDNISLHQLLQEEIKSIAKKEVDFSNCLYSLV